MPEATLRYLSRADIEALAIPMEAVIEAVAGALGRGSRPPE